MSDLRVTQAAHMKDGFVPEVDNAKYRKELCGWATFEQEEESYSYKCVPQCLLSALEGT